MKLNRDMNKLTARQRGEIYLKVAEIFFNGDHNKKHTCFHLEKLIGGWSLNYYSMLKYNFPEFLLFDPNKIYWWMIYGTENEERILALLFSYEMSKTEKL